MSNSNGQTRIPAWFEFLFLFFLPAFILTPCSMHRGLYGLCSNAQNRRRNPGQSIPQSNEFTQRLTVWHHFLLDLSSLCSEHPGQTQDADGCEKGPHRLAQSLDPMGMCVPPFGTNVRLRADSFLAEFFHVYTSYRKTFTKRELHKWF